MKQFEIQRLKVTSADFDSRLSALLHRDQPADPQIDQAVAEIIAQVRENGDQALFKYTRQFDGFTPEKIELPQQRLQQAFDAIDDQQRQALLFAAQRIETYHQKQKQASWDYIESNGNQLGQKITALDRVGLYVPGGKAAYPSSVLMNAIPAKVAAVNELIMVTPTPNGELNEMVLAAAKIANVDRVFTIGGAQAVAALAYGTESLPAVDKIVGPGNIYVVTAKKQVFGKVGIDMIAGPSEVLVIADDSVDSDWLAMDLFAQAEHDEMAQSILLTRDETVLNKVVESINKLLPTMERAEIIAKSLSSNGALVLAETNNDLVNIANTIAAEHLQIFTEDAPNLADQIDHAGALFIGKYSAETMGDYCAGPNHVLPTSGTARFSSPLGVYDFQKRSSIIHCTEQGAQEIGKNASILARGESLTAHALSAEYRLKSN